MKLKSPNDEAKYVLRKMLAVAGDKVCYSHQWLCELDRWKEFAFALLIETTEVPQPLVRVITDHLMELDLLNIPVLSRIPRDQTDDAQIEDPDALRILEILSEGGFSKIEAMNGLIVLCEASEILSTRYKNKVQLLLRSHGNKMVKDMEEIFHFEKMDPKSAKRAFTYWLQNVANMPMTLHDQSLESFTKAHNLTEEQLFAAADELDVNVALVDDLVHYLHVDVKPPEDANT